MTRARICGALCALVVLLSMGHAEARERARPLAGQINVNAATPDELGLLPGIGSARAEAIVTRRQHRPFRRVEELRKIRGIGAKTYSRIRMYVTVEGKTTLRRADDPGPEPEPRRTL